MTENALSHKIIGAAIQFHRQYGPGLLESVYETALAHDLSEIGLVVERQVHIPFVYKEIEMEAGYRIDLLVNRKVLIEIKSVDEIAKVHLAQTLTYLKLANLRLGLLINFNVSLLKDGIYRIVNKL